MKKLLAMLLVLCMTAMMLTACGGGEGGGSNTPKETDSMTLEEALESMGDVQINWAIVQ